MRNDYLRLLTFVVDHAAVFLILFLVFAVGSVGLLLPWLGQDFFPSVDSGQFKIHVRAHTGTRIEETAALCDHVDATIRSRFRPMSWSPSSTTSACPTRRSISPTRPRRRSGPRTPTSRCSSANDHHPTAAMSTHARQSGPQYPGVTFYALPVDIVTQILNFGLAAPIDIQIVGPDLTITAPWPRRMLERGPLCSRCRRYPHPAAVQRSQLDGERGPHPRAGRSA